jgi:hypothetical protein
LFARTDLGSGDRTREWGQTSEEWGQVFIVRHAGRSPGTVEEWGQVFIAEEKLEECGQVFIVRHSVRNPVVPPTGREPQTYTP